MFFCQRAVLCSMRPGNKAQRQITALSETRNTLGTMYSIFPERLDYDSANRAMVIEYVGKSSDGATLLKEDLLNVLVGCGHGIREVGWPEDFERIVGVAIDPVDVGMAEPQAVRWVASAEWLQQTLTGEISDAILQKRTMETAEWVYNDGSTEKVDVNVELVE